MKNDKKSISFHINNRALIQHQIDCTIEFQYNLPLYTAFPIFFSNIRNYIQVELLCLMIHGKKCMGTACPVPKMC